MIDYFWTEPSGEVARTKMARWARSSVDVVLGRAASMVVTRVRVAAARFPPHITWFKWSRSAEGVATSDCS